MNHRNIHKSKYSWILILCIIVGLLSSLYLVFERHQIEKSQNHIENIVDYDAVLRANAFEKRSQQEAFDALRNAGVTAFAIYDRTLEKAKDAGQVKVLTSEEMDSVRVNGASIKHGATYVGLSLVKKVITKKFVKIYIIALARIRLKNLIQVSALF